MLVGSLVVGHFRRDDVIWALAVITVIWVVWVSLTIGSLISADPSAADPLAFLIRVWQQNRDYVIQIGVALTIVVFVGWPVVLRRRQEALDQSQDLTALRGLSPGEFEDWCAARLRGAGWRVTATGGQSDHGVDLLAERGTSRIAVQCKRYGANTRPIGEAKVRELVGAMQHCQATWALLLTTGRFTPQARAWAQGKSVDLLDAQQLSAIADFVKVLANPRS